MPVTLDLRPGLIRLPWVAGYANHVMLVHLLALLVCIIAPDALLITSAISLFPLLVSLVCIQLLAPRMLANADALPTHRMGCITAPVIQDFKPVVGKIRGIVLRAVLAPLQRFPARRVACVHRTTTAT